MDRIPYWAASDFNENWVRPLFAAMIAALCEGRHCRCPSTRIPTFQSFFVNSCEFMSTNTPISRVAAPILENRP